MNDIFKMKLHSTLDISKSLTVIRVPGGWIYKTKSFSGLLERGMNVSVSSTFVPFCKEFID